jgi:cytochrome P450
MTCLPCAGDQLAVFRLPGHAHQRRCATKDLVLGGKWFIPRGSWLWIPFTAVHESGVNFLEPGRYLPERWLPITGDCKGASMPVDSSKFDIAGATPMHLDGSAPVIAEAAQGSSVGDGSKDTADGGWRAGSTGSSNCHGAPTLQGNSDIPVKSWIPFSDGPRNCIGQALAMMTMRATMAVRSA